ncbi:precorrin-3B synthase [soil metagenome]
MARIRDQDACPGTLTLHQAADGALLRVRLPGGMISAAQLTALARAATEFGSGTLELTSRGSLQLRGLEDTPDTMAAVTALIADAGLLPSATHERVRNIVSSPLSGRVGGLADVRPWVAELDAAIQADQALTQLTGRFWFSIDDGRGDVSGLRADVGVHVLDSGGEVALLLAGTDTGIRVPAADAIRTMTTVAGRFAEIRGKRWRVSELDDRSPLLTGFSAATPAGAEFESTTRGPVGWFEQDDSRAALGAAVPLGVLAARTAEFLAAIEAPMVITPWRTVLVCDLDEGVADVSLRVLAPMGLVFDENSPWLDVSACTGSPGCDHSAADVRADAEAFVLAAAADGGTNGVHHRFVGCERACGSPLIGEVLIATAEGYRAR